MHGSVLIAFLLTLLPGSRGIGVLLHCDYHDVSFRERYRGAGFLFPDEFVTKEQKEEFEKLIGERVTISESARLRRALVG